MPEWLTKEYGPFSGTEWAVIIVGGVGLGLALRFYLNRRGGDQSAAPGATGTTAPDYGVDTGVSPFTSGGTQFNQGQIVQDVLEAMDTQTPPPATTDPETLSADSSIGAKLAGLRAEHSRLTALMNQRALQRRNYDPNGGSAEREHYQRLQNEISEMRLARDRVTQQIATLEGQLEYAEDRK